MPDAPEIPVKEVLEAGRGRFGQIVAVAIVVTTLLAALCGYLQASSLSRNADALSRSEQWGALASKVANENQQIEQLLLERYHAAEGDRLQSAYLAGRALFGSPSASDVLGAHRWQQVADNVNTDSGVLAAGIRREFASIRRVDDATLLDPGALKVNDGPRCPVAAWARSGSAEGRIPPVVGDDALGEGPDQDPHFPSVYEADDQRQVFQLDGLRDAATTEAAQAEKQFTRYAVSLATLAVALFMFGYSLTPHGRHHRKMYAAVAGVLVLGASLWGMYSVLRAPHEAAPQAMAAYADGRVALDRGDFRQAVSYFTCSIDQDPGFAAAYTWRATAVAGSAPTLYHLMPDQLRRAVADYQQALALGSSDPAALNGLSAGLFVLGMRRNDAGLIQQARGFMARARQRDPSDPVIAFNLAEDQLMLGRGAARAYSGTDTLAREFPDVALDSLGSLESDLATPLGRRHGVAIAAAKQQVVAALSSSSPAANPAQHPSPPGAAGSASLSVSLQGGNIAPGQLEFSITGARGFVPQRDRLYAVWYEREGGSWEAIQGASGPVSLRRGASVLETVPGQCLAASQYLLELYVNGRLAGRAVADSRSAALRYATLDDMNFSLCHPTGWRRAAAWQPGLIEGFASPSGNAGMLVADVTPAAASPRLLDEVLKRLGSRIPAHLAPARRLPETEFAGGLCRSYVQEDSYPGGVLAAGIGRDAFDRQLVGIVYGPYAMFGAADSAPPLASDLFTSMISSAPPAAGTC